MYSVNYKKVTFFLMTSSGRQDLTMALGNISTFLIPNRILCAQPSSHLSQGYPCLMFTPNSELSSECIIPVGPVSCPSGDPSGRYFPCKEKSKIPPTIKRLSQTKRESSCCTGVSKAIQVKLELQQHTVCSFPRRACFGSFTAVSMSMTGVNS